MDEEILKKWCDHGITFNEKSSEAEILSLERRIAFVFPEDFKNLYLRVNGFKDGDWTPNFFSFLSLERIREEYEDPQNDKNFIPICDYLVASHFLGYLKNEMGIFKDYGQIEKVCHNIHELAKLIDIDSTILY